MAVARIAEITSGSRSANHCW